MLKFLTIAIAVTVVSFFLSKSVFGQTVTPTSTPMPTGSSAVPTRAPATGFGPY